MKKMTDKDKDPDFSPSARSTSYKRWTENENCLYATFIQRNFNEMKEDKRSSKIFKIMAEFVKSKTN